MIELRIGDDFYDIEQHDGQLRCPFCEGFHEDEHALRTHMGKTHGVDRQYTKECPNCGDEFQTNPSYDHTFCSQACMENDRKTCRFCGHFMAKDSEQDHCENCTLIAKVAE